MIERLARYEGLSTSEWVRRRLREATEARVGPDIEAKHAAIEAAYRVEAPTSDIATMLAEIERGYLEVAAT